MNEAKVEQKPVGGFAFFLSLGALLLLCLNNVFIMPKLLFMQPIKFMPLLTFVGGVLGGSFIAAVLFTSHLKVFIHEVQHSLVSGLAGNKWKGMKVRSRSGHFEYSYTKDTAHLNAFISLAPYLFPLFLSVFLVAGIALFYGKHHLITLMAGVGCGLDLVCHIRDISPHQTDLSLIRGGYGVGLTYVVLANVFFITTLCIWVIAENAGLKSILLNLWNLGFSLRELLAT